MSRWIIVLALVLVPSNARTDEAPCDTWEVEYALSGRFRLSDTHMGAGDGEHEIGPGKLVMRFDGDDVSVTRYELTNRFTVSARVLGVGTTVVNDSITRATPNECGVIASGTLGDNVLRWSGPWNGVRTDGQLECSGVCGTFGAPPRGRTELHMGPTRLRFNSFAFAPNAKTFRMDWVVFDKTAASTTSLELVGREVRRACVQARPCAGAGPT